MPAAKVKAKLKVKPKVAAKPKAVGKLKAKSKAVIKAIKKTVAVVAPKVPEAKPALAAHETVFERLLRLKAERNAQFHQQAEKNHSSHDHRMPANHARYSKFAGPRRRAS